MDALLWLALTFGTADHPKAISPTSVRTQIERLAIPIYGETGWKCLDRLIRRESQWDHLAKNPRSSARGLFQLLRLPPNLSPVEQFERGNRYLANRYGGSPCVALAHSLEQGWY